MNYIGSGNSRGQSVKMPLFFLLREPASRAGVLYAISQVRLKTDSKFTLFKDKDSRFRSKQSKSNLEAKP
jgi:hypothetical protein